MMNQNKNISNSEWYDPLFQQTIGNYDIIYCGTINVDYLHVNHDLYVDNEIRLGTSTMHDNGSQMLTLNGGINAPYGISTDGGISRLTYSQGSFSPELAFIKNDGVLDYPAYSLAQGDKNGYYIKMGNVVTVWIEVNANMNDSYAYFTQGVRFPIIKNLPFKYTNPGTSIKLSSKAPCYKGEWPNGIGAGFAPAIAAPTYPKPYDVIAYEEGYPVRLAVYDGAVIECGTFTSDGYTAMFYGKTNLYGAGLQIPPWQLWGTDYLPLSNAHVLLGQLYYVEFSCSFTYTTDE